jgi:hypothetical protein
MRPDDCQWLHAQESEGWGQAIGLWFGQDESCPKPRASGENQVGFCASCLLNCISTALPAPNAESGFNQNLADRAQYGFTYCMVMTGNFEGQVGWISSKRVWNPFCKPFLQKGFDFRG